MAADTATVSAFGLSIPLRAPFRTASMRITHRKVFLVRAERGDHHGWGEAAPFPGQDESMEELVTSAQQGIPTPTLLAGIDEALADLDARKAGEPLAHTVSTQVPICAAVGIEDAVEKVDALVDSGVERFKVKIAPGNTAHVAVIRTRYPDVTIGIDGNASFSASGIDELERLGSLGITFAEEPFDDWQNPAVLQLAERTGIPLFADEAVRSAADADRLLAVPGVDGITIKPGRLGWRGALAARKAALRVGKRWRASGLLETGVGRVFSDILAAMDGADVSDVAPAETFLTEDVVLPRRIGARVEIPQGAGTGVEPMPDVIDRYLNQEVQLGTWTLSDW